MRRLSVFIFLLVAQTGAAQAATELCASAAAGIEASLRAFKPGGRTRESYRAISIRNAVAKKPAAGLNYGATLDEAGLKQFPLTDKDRALFRDSVNRIFRAGGRKGLVLLDAEAGTAHCHNSVLFSLAGAQPKALPLPEPGDPYELCSYGGVVLGAVGDTAFYAQSEDDFLETDRLKIFAVAGEKLAQACVIAAKYALGYETAESFCAEPELCRVYSGRATQWAQKFAESKGRVADPNLTPASPATTPDDDPTLMPLFGAAASRIVPEPFRFDGEESWFATPGDPRVDVLRIGVANQGPANMAQWDAFTLATLYKSGQPVASFVVQRRRFAFRALTVRTGD
jgi:hypothetical protein